MAMKAGMGFSKIIILVGAVAFLGYTGTLMWKNGKLSDALVKGYEQNQGDGGEGDYADAIAAQITVMNGGTGVVPAAAMGAVESEQNKISFAYETADTKESMNRNDSAESHLVGVSFHLVHNILDLVLLSTDVRFCYVYKTTAYVLHCVIRMLWAPNG
ncbi:hypothetical protein L1987_48636 [Smallanthus sonchifolius]|uniref:Uncharacterized protein n=1 Tax=Smallanthus sonchifolius TaxID=185202 RepID=A0ACB9FTI2_9ASTR|nr:hypothetical protein L1987_48636 [Smallanthus sonchifolius]